MRVSNLSKVKELLADFNIENPRKVLTPMDPGLVITEKSVHLVLLPSITEEGNRQGWRVRETTGRG